MSTSKSSGQRALELVAVVAATACLSFLAYSLWTSRQKSEPLAKPSPRLTSPPPVATKTPPATIPPSSSTPPIVSRRGSFQSQDIGLLKIGTTAIRPDNDPLPTVSDEDLKPVRMRHLATYTSTLANIFQFAPDARTAVAIEHTEANTDRVTVWSLETNQLVRFCGHELGKEVAKFDGGRESCYVDFNRLRHGAISPDGTKFACRQNAFFHTEITNFYIWDITSGKLLVETCEIPEFSDVFEFISDDKVCTGIWLPSHYKVPVTIDANTGTMELLHPVSLWLGLLSVASHGQRIAISNEIQAGFIILPEKRFIPFESPYLKQELKPAPIPGEEVKKEEAPRDEQEPQYVQMWFSADGSRVFGADNVSKTIDEWDVATRTRTTYVPIDLQRHPSKVLARPRAGYLAESLANVINVFDLSTGTLRSRLRLPFSAGGLADISADGRSIAVHTDQHSVLILEFPEGVQPGDLAVDRLLKGKALEATR